MSDDQMLTPQLREEMGDWVMGYVGRRRRRRRLALAGAAAVTLIAVGTASAWVVLAPRAVIERTVTCYEQPAVDSRTSGGELAGDSLVGDPAANAVDLCSSLWQLGVLSQDAAATPGTDGATHPVPKLVLCTHRDGTYAVFPARGTGGVSAPAQGAGFCDALDLVPAQHDG